MTRALSLRTLAGCSGILGPFRLDPDSPYSTDTWRQGINPPHPHEGHTARRELNETENLNAAKPLAKARVFLKIGLQRFVSLYSGHQPGYGEVGIAYRRSLN